MEDLINMANSQSNPDKKKEAIEYVKEVIKKKEDNKINLNVEFGEYMHHVYIPMKIGNNNKILHIVMDSNGSYKIEKYSMGDRIRFFQMATSSNTGTIVGYDIKNNNRYVVKTDHNEFIEISEGNISGHIS